MYVLWCCLCASVRARKQCKTHTGARIAQLVERPTERPGAIPTRVRVPGAARDFSPRVSFQCRLRLLRCPYSPLCAIACINSCVYVKNPKHWQPYPLCPNTRKILHAPIEMGSAALAAAVPHQVKTTPISDKVRFIFHCDCERAQVDRTSS